MKLCKHTQQYIYPHGMAKTCFLPIPLNLSSSSIYDKWTVWLVKDTASKHCQDARSSLKIRIRHKPGLGLLHKFILSADGAHVFLILPPEFQVCQERSEAAKDFFFFYFRLARNRMSLSCLGGRELALFEYLSLVSPTSPFPSHQAETSKFSAPLGNGEFSLRPPENIFLSKSAFHRHKTANTARNVLSEIENAYKLSSGPLLECLC